MFKGSMPALMTPFGDDGAVDIDAFEKFVEWQIAQGSHGLVPTGTTGESPTLTHEEHKLLIRICVDVSGGRVPVLAGTGSNSTREAIELTEYAEEAGADGALVVTPYYNKPSQQGLYEHFRDVHDQVDIPIIIYNIPGRSVVDMSVETMAELAELPRIIGVKDATGDLARVAAQRLTAGSDFIQLSGEDATALGFMAMGGHGCISVTANVAPRLCSAFQEACMAGDFAKALDYQDKLYALHDLMFMEPSPAPVKFVCSLLGLCHDRVRRPLTAMSEQGKAIAASIVNQAGLTPVL